MSASSVTGIGSGAAYGQKGPGNKRDQTVPVSSPHVLAAGNTGSISTATTITLPYALSVQAANVVVVATSSAGTVTASSLTNVDDTSGPAVGVAAGTYATGTFPNYYNGFKTFVLTPSTTATVYWMVVLAGQGIDEIQPTFVGPAPVQPVYQYNEPN
jgi:hypothetical protein